MSGVLIYDSNNSGGGWWLSDDAWDALAAAGWNVHWGERNYADPMAATEKAGKRFLGALATCAAKQFQSATTGIEEWERITGQDAGAAGCNCCGPPHEFEWVDDDGTKKRSWVEVPASGRLLWE